MNKIGVIGAVTSTAVTIEALVRHGFEIVGVLGHEPNRKEHVSGHYDLRGLSIKLNIPFQGYQKINDDQHIKWMAEKKPDLIFAVGFSQLLGSSWLTLTPMGCIGFHPTRLPKGRGRAPLAWVVLKERKGAASFFLMGEGADDGPLFVQESFELSEGDDATSTQKLIWEAQIKALDRWLPNLKAGIWNPIAQNEVEASWYGKRGPSDGCIKWESDALEIDRLIKASTTPHPGAYTYYKGKRLIIWKSEVENSIPIQGVVGCILVKQPEKGLLVQCLNGHVWLKEYESESQETPRVGEKLGFSIEDEIYMLWQKLNSLK